MGIFLADMSVVAAQKNLNHDVTNLIDSQSVYKHADLCFLKQKSQLYHNSQVLILHCFINQTHVKECLIARTDQHAIIAILNLALVKV